MRVHRCTIVTLLQAIFWWLSSAQQFSSVEYEQDFLPFHSNTSPEDNFREAEEVTFSHVCPLSCVCQQAQLRELPIYRWISEMQKQYTTSHSKDDHNYGNDGDNDLINLTTCIVLPDTDIKWLLESLPMETEALNLLYTGVGQIKSMNASALGALKQLRILEIQGPKDSYFRLILDIPLDTITKANFEQITIIGSESSARPKGAVLPKELYNYKPTLNSEPRDVGDSAFELQPNNNNDPIPEILPYELYIEEVRRAQIPSFYGWHNLGVLRIHHCDLNQLSWETFLGLDSLLHLSLEYNRIEELQPFTFSGASQLRTLSLAHNSLELLHYRDLAGLFELQILDLSDNNLKKLNEIMFPPLPKLLRLDLRHNPLQYIFPAAFWVMNSTEFLYFGSMESSLKLWNNAPFKMLSHLKELEINNVSITTLDQNMFKELTSLQILRLHGQVNAIEFDAFATLTHLETLDLSNCRLREISMDAFTNCKSLRVINMAQNELSTLPSGLYDDLPALEEIYLEQNRLETLPANFMSARRESLKLVHLIDNPWKCSCEMASWKAKITNQEKFIPQSPRCIHDYQSGEMISCRSQEIFQYNRKFTPRCANFKGRSVYYVLRKQLRCPSLKGTGTSSARGRNKEGFRRLAHWQKLNMKDNQKVPKSANGMERSVNRINNVIWQINNNSNSKSTVTERRNGHGNNQDISNNI